MCDNTCTTDCGKCKGGLSFYQFRKEQSIYSGGTVWVKAHNLADAEYAFRIEHGFWPVFTGQRKAA